MAERNPPSLQLCPTRIDGTEVLFAHKVSAGQCQDRQRGHYHKCFTCAYNNVYMALHGAPVEIAARAQVVAKRQVQVG